MEIFNDMDKDDSLLDIENTHFSNTIECLKTYKDRKISEIPNITSLINSSKVYDELVRGSSEHLKYEDDILNNVPDEVYTDTPGEYLYGCFFSQNEVSPECTPSCISGFSNSKLLTCNFPVLEIRMGEVIKLNNYTGERGYLFTHNTKVSKKDLNTIYRKYGVARVDVFMRQGKTIKYKFIETLPTKDNDHNPIIENIEEDTQYQDTNIGGRISIYIIPLLVIGLIVVSILIFHNIS